MESLLEKIKELEQKVYRDSLTGSYNHRYYDELLFLQPEDGKDLQSIAVVMTDMQKFKLINDTYGHLAGDACLQAVANVFREWLEPEDALIRFGGDEFLLIIKNRAETEVAELLEKMQQQVSGIRFSEYADLRCSVNAGCAYTERADEMTADGIRRLLQAADAEMYREKFAESL